MVISVIGASGSGTTTVARIICEKLGQDYIHIDIDDYLWKKTAVPFTYRNSDDFAINSIKKILLNNKNIIISGILYSIGKECDKYIDTVIVINTSDTNRRIRLIEREKKEFGSRVEPGGDMYEQFCRFLKWAMNYKNNLVGCSGEKRTQEWIADLNCKTFELDNDNDIEYLYSRIESILEEIKATA